MVDALATLSSMIIVNPWNDMPKIDLMHLDRPAYVFAIETVTDDRPWYHDIKCFLQNRNTRQGHRERIGRRYEG